jgi:hypothetical protein
MQQVVSRRSYCTVLPVDELLMLMLMLLFCLLIGYFLDGTRRLENVIYSYNWRHFAIFCVVKNATNF